MTYTWKYVQTGKIRRKFTFYVCTGNLIVGNPITDATDAWHFEQAAIKAGNTFTESIDEFLQDQKKLIESKINHWPKPHQRQVMVMNQKSFNAFLRGD